MPRITHDSDIRHFRAKNMTHKKKETRKLQVSSCQSNT